MVLRTLDLTNDSGRPDDAFELTRPTAAPGSLRRQGALAMRRIGHEEPASVPRDGEAWRQIASEAVGAKVDALAGAPNSGGDHLLATISLGVSLDELGKLKLVNDFVNEQVAFADDAENWQAIEYWASPMETMERGRGDCDDFAIAKYFALSKAGIPSTRLRLMHVTVVQQDGVAQAHMVLGYFAEDPAGPPGASVARPDPLILDNLHPSILPLTKRPDLSAKFSFNREGLWTGAEGGAPTGGDPRQRLPRWRDVVSKAEREGFR